MTTKTRILAPFNHIKLILLCCQFAVAVADHRDCGQVEQCITDPQGNVWCSLFNNASTNHLAIMKMIIINENISSAIIDDENVKIYWNTHSQDIFLMIPSDYQRGRGLDIYTVPEGNASPVHVHVEFYNVQVTGQVLQTGENKQLILNCSVTGIHNSSNVVEFRFNDEKSYSCTKTGWPNDPEDSTDKPYVRLLDNTTCQLIIPNAAKADFTDYYCRVKLALSPESADHTCHLLSEKTTPSDFSENSISIIIISIVVPVAIVIIIIVVVMILAVVAKKGNQPRQHPQQPPENQQEQIHYVPPGVRLGRNNDVHDVDGEQMANIRERQEEQVIDSGSGHGTDPSLANAESVA